MASICSWENSASSSQRLLGAARERARLGDRGEIAIGLGGRGAAIVTRPLGRAYEAFGRIRSTSACGRGMTCTDIELADAPRGGGAGVGGGLHRADVAAHHAR